MFNIVLGNIKIYYILLLYIVKLYLNWITLFNFNFKYIKYIIKLKSLIVKFSFYLKKEGLTLIKATKLPINRLFLKGIKIYKIAYLLKKQKVLL